MKIYEYENKITLEQFSEQTCEAVCLIEEFKKKINSNLKRCGNKNPKNHKRSPKNT